MKKLLLLTALIIGVSQTSFSQLIRIPIADGFDENPTSFVNLGGITYFIAYTTTHRTELWKSDGTIAGTVEVADINPTSGHGLTDSKLHIFNGKLYFFANNGTNGYELWESDGTGAGTTLVKDIYPGTSSSCIFSGNTIRPDITSTAQYMYFFARDTAGNNRYGLWRSDGTAGGTIFLKALQTSYYFMCPVSNLMYFTASDGTTGEELWVSDGTTGGTQLVKDIRTGNSGSNPRWFVKMGTDVFFSATDGTNGIELYKTDGTAIGTVQVKDINPYGNSSPSHLSAFNGKVLFYATDSTNGVEPWVSDGTLGGTQLLANITAGAGSSASLVPFTQKGDSAYFTAAGQFWLTDGTPGGSARFVSNLISAPVAFALHNNRLYFMVRNSASSSIIYSTSNIIDTVNHGGMGFAPGATLNTLFAGTNALYTVLKNTIFDFSSLYKLNYGECSPKANITGNVPLTCNEHQVTLDVGNAYDIYTWSTSATTSQISVSVPGTYIVNVQDSALGCSSADTVVVTMATANVIDIPEICAVTVDSATGENLIIWNKHNPRISETLFRIEKETATNVFTAIADVPFDSLSAYIDTASNPQVTSYRYRMILLDSCGNISVAGTEHQTVHLSQNAGINGQVNLQWNAYIGTSYTQVNVLRSVNGAAWAVLTTLPGNVYSYSDLTPPTGTLNYQIEVLIDSTCTPSRSTWGVFSNKITHVSTGLNSYAQQSFTFGPNPVEGTLQIQWPSAQPDGSLYITDVTGKVLQTIAITGNHLLVDVSGLAAGTYLLNHHTGLFKPQYFVKQ
jgi:ELWxxDGT repeat protein